MSGTALLLAAPLAAIALAACGGEGGDGEEAGRPALPYPPRAAEPARAPEPAERPAGRVVPVGNGPEGLAFDPETGLIAAGLREPNQLALVDGRSGEVRRRVPLPEAPRHLQLAAPGGPVLVPAERADALVEVRLPGGQARSTPAGDHPHDATAIGDRYFTADEFGSTVSVIQDGRRLRTEPVDVQPGGIAAVDDRIALISVRAYTVELLDPETLRGMGAESAGEGPTHVVADDDERLYIADTRGDAVIVYGTRPRLRFRSRIALPGGPYGIAIARDRVYVTLSGGNELVELTTGDQPRETRRWPTVRQPNTVAADPRSGRVAVASRTDGTLQLLDP
jgi:DNA-binding beta-propeller fold protein YncE